MEKSDERDTSSSREEQHRGQQRRCTCLTMHLLAGRREKLRLCLEQNGNGKMIAEKKMMS